MYKILFRVVRKIRKILFFIFYSRRFNFLGNNSSFFKPFRIDGINNISIGKSTEFQKGTWIYCENNISKSSLVIGDNCIFGYNNHIVAIGEIIIGNNVLTANQVYISDNIHEYKNINIPIMNQPVVCTGKISIGDGSWLGENVCIIGASIGRNCVIGANTVVTNDIPDYCVAVGTPARIIKQFNIVTGNWEIKQ